MVLVFFFDSATKSAFFVFRAKKLKYLCTSKPIPINYTTLLNRRGQFRYIVNLIIELKNIYHQILTFEETVASFVLIQTLLLERKPIQKHVMLLAGTLLFTRASER